MHCSSLIFNIQSAPDSSYESMNTGAAMRVSIQQRLYTTGQVKTSTLRKSCDPMKPNFPSVGNTVIQQSAISPSSGFAHSGGKAAHMDISGTVRDTDDWAATNNCFNWWADYIIMLKPSLLWFLRELRRSQKWAEGLGSQPRHAYILETSISSGVLISDVASQS